MLDDHHNKVGTVSDVVYDERGEPTLGRRRPGPLRSEKFVPVEGAYITESGEVVIPYAKDQVKHGARRPPATTSSTPDGARSSRRTTSL